MAQSVMGLKTNSVWSIGSVVFQSCHQLYSFLALWQVTDKDQLW